ncbi:MAG: hypothetical protein ACOVO1_06245 [Chitinophagaceae bacterium]
MNIQDLVKNHSDKIVEKLVTDLLSQNHVEVRFDYFEQDQWAVVSINQYEEDKEFSLRLHSNNVYDLMVGYYDDEDEFFEIIKPLNDAEIESIPDGLKKIMKKVVIDEQGLRVQSVLLVGKK